MAGKALNKNVLTSLLTLPRDTITSSRWSSPDSIPTPIATPPLVRKPLAIVFAAVIFAFGLYQMRNGIFEVFPRLAADSDVTAAAKKATKAAADFAVLAKDSAQTGKVPRQSDPAVGPLLDMLFNLGAVTSKPALLTSDLGALADWGKAIVEVGAFYLLAGTGASDLAHAGSDPIKGEQINRNMITYAPEIGRWLDAALTIQTTTGDVAAAAVADHTFAKSGLEQVRGGVTTTVGGFIGALATDGLSDEWRRDRVRVLPTVAPKLANFLPQDQRKRLPESALAVGKSMSDADVKSGLQAFADALN
jgi:hypothetical protein